MGAHFSLTIHENVDLPELLKRRIGIALAADLGGSRSLYATKLDGPVAWILGNEGAGVSPALLQSVDVSILIPMPGAAESLNVAAAAAICLFEQVRQRGNACNGASPAI
jgi:TrmH family RNA methyltransferase